MSTTGHAAAPPLESNGGSGSRPAPTDDPALALVAFALAPGPGGAEASVNLDLARRLVSSWRGPLLTVSGGSMPIGVDGRPLEAAGRTDRRTWALQSTSESDLSWAARILSRCERQGRRRRLSPGRAVGRFAYERRGDHLKYLAWEHALTPTLRRFIGRHDAPVVWSRALPLASLTAAHRVIERERGVRWIVNLNDPCPPGIWPGLYPVPTRTAGKLRRSFERMLPRIDALTSPSRRLLELHTTAYPALAEVPARIVPHAVPPLDGASELPDSDWLTLGFGGSLRHYMISEDFTAGLARFARTRPEHRLRLAFHLTAPSAPLEELARSSPVPIEIVTPEGAPSSIDQRLQRADALLQIEGALDAPLLLTKMVGYARFGKPIVAVCPPDGTTADLVAPPDCGWHAAHDDPDGIAEMLAAVHDRWSEASLPEPPSESRLARLPSAEHAMGQIRGLLDDLDAGHRGLCGPTWP